MPREDTERFAEHLPMCKDCPQEAKIYLLRPDGWSNVCTDCYKRFFYDGKLPPKINEWKGATENSKRIAAEIAQRIKGWGRRPMNRDWAKRILDRHRAGETISSRAMELALEVAGDAPAPLPLRDPGQD